MKVLFIATLVVAVITAAASVTLAHRGFDISQAFSQDAFHCAKKKGLDFGVARVYMETGALDPNGKDSLKKMLNANIHAQAYHFPAVHVDAHKQVKASVDHIKDLSISRFWFDVEPGGCTHCLKCDKLKELIHAAKKLLNGTKMTLGIYANDWSWSSTVGLDCKAGGDLPLWYANYDNQKNFNDFAPFGPFDRSSLFAKQFNDHCEDARACGINADGDWKP